MVQAHTETTEQPTMRLLHTVSNGRTVCGAPRATGTPDRNRPHCAKCTRVMRIIAMSKPRKPVTVTNFLPSDNPADKVVTHTVYGHATAPGERYRRQALR